MERHVYVGREGSHSLMQLRSPTGCAIVDEGNALGTASEKIPSP